MQLDSRRRLGENTYLKIILTLLFSFYCYLSILPKHGDFFSLNDLAQLIAKGHFDFYEIYTESHPGIIGNMHPPLFYFIDGAWIKFGSLLHIYDLYDMQFTNSSTQFWCMLPYLLILLACAVISYKTLKNRWLSLLWFGTFTFISVIIMGQTDIFASFFIFVSVIMMIKSFHSDKYALYMYIGLLSLGVSTLIKTYGFVLFPLYLLIIIKFIYQRTEDLRLKCKLYSILLILVSFTLVSPMLIYGKWVSGIASGESSWVFNLQTFGVWPFQAISIWLLGYCIIIYVMAKRLLGIRLPREYTEFFVFFGMLDLSWFFISVHTHPQWWLILVPFIIAVLDNSGSVSSYIFALLIYNLYLLYPMRWINNIDLILRDYIIVVPIEGNNSLILFTLMAATLVIWTIELQQELKKIGNKSDVDKKKNLKENIILPILVLISPLAMIGLMPLMVKWLGAIFGR